VQIDNPRGKGLLGDEHHVAFESAYCLFEQRIFSSDREPEKRKN